MRIEELILISNVDHHQMNGTIYRPDNVKKVVLLIHGMASHEKRHAKLATQMANQGCLVLAPDLRGHGRSPFEGVMGLFANNEGYFRMIRDLNQLVSFIRETYPLDVILFGHSMGALFALDYLKRYPKHISGVILSGTPTNNQLGRVFKSMLYPLVARRPKEPNKLLQKAMNKVFVRDLENYQSDYDWVSSDQEQVKQYLEDPLCGFPLTNAGYSDLFALLDDVYNKKAWRSVDSKLPIYILYGLYDPVSNAKRKGHLQTEQFLLSQGLYNITKFSYPNSRHEVFNDTDTEQYHEDIRNIINNL